MTQLKFYTFKYFTFQFFVLASDFKISKHHYKKLNDIPLYLKDMYIFEIMLKAKESEFHY